MGAPSEVLQMRFFSPGSHCELVVDLQFPNPLQSSIFAYRALYFIHHDPRHWQLTPRTPVAQLCRLHVHNVIRRSVLWPSLTYTGGVRPADRCRRAMRKHGASRSAMTAKAPMTTPAVAPLVQQSLSRKKD